MSWDISHHHCLRASCLRRQSFCFVPGRYALCRSQRPIGLRRGSAAAQLLRLQVRIPPEAWMSVSSECCVLSGWDLCDGPITSPEERYRLWCVIVCGLETSKMGRPWPALGWCATERNKKGTSFVCQSGQVFCVIPQSLQKHSEIVP